MLNKAPLELVGRVSIDGSLLFDDDPPRRVQLLATTGKIWVDKFDRFVTQIANWLSDLS